MLLRSIRESIVFRIEVSGNAAYVCVHVYANVCTSTFDAQIVLLVESAKKLNIYRNSLLASLKFPAFVDNLVLRTMVSQTVIYNNNGNNRETKQFSCIRD